MAEICLVTDIQKFAVNDGPGFRTNVFLKGCPLSCAWCHNPETISAKPDLFWKRRLCVQCGACLTACPRDAVNPPVDPAFSQPPDSGYQKIIRDRCDNCLACVAACNYGALLVSGTPMSVPEILDIVEQDRPFYDNSGGGMTLSGGEPTANLSFASKLLAGSRDRGIHNCLDTNGFCHWSALEELLQNSDIVLFDLKHLDPDLHKRMTGVDNRLILENLARLAKERRAELWIRIPVIPGFNDSLEFHLQAADFIANLPGPVARVDLLAFHNWCQDKYDWLGMDWNLRETEAMDPGMLEIPMDFYKEKGLFCTVGGSGFETEQAAGM
ncbi:MAG: glycyl-radical enzyme activating protein [Thermodesulfobacteriota bacterium]